MSVRVACSLGPHKSIQDGRSHEEVPESDWNTFRVWLSDGFYVWYTSPQTHGGEGPVGLAEGARDARRAARDYRTVGLAKREWHTHRLRAVVPRCWVGNDR